MEGVVANSSMAAEMDRLTHYDQNNSLGVATCRNRNRKAGFETNTSAGFPCRANRNPFRKVKTQNRVD